MVQFSSVARVHQVKYEKWAALQRTPFHLRYTSRACYITLVCDSCNSTWSENWYHHTEKETSKPHCRKPFMDNHRSKNICSHENRMYFLLFFIDHFIFTIRGENESLMEYSQRLKLPLHCLVLPGFERSGKACYWEGRQLPFPTSDFLPGFCLGSGAIYYSDLLGRDKTKYQTL